MSLPESDQSPLSRVLHFPNAQFRTGNPRNCVGDVAGVGERHRGDARRRRSDTRGDPVQFYWTQHFPARAAVEITHTYRPVVGGSYVYMSDDGLRRIEPYCGGRDALDQITKLKREHPPKNPDDVLLFERQIQYILTTANNWKESIGKFHLSVVADSPADIMVTCMPGVKRTTPTQYELTRSNFRPERELELLLLQLPK